MHLCYVDEDDEEVDEEEEDKFYSADEGYDASHPEDGEGTGSDSDQSPLLKTLRSKVCHHLPSFLTSLSSLYLLILFLLFNMYISSFVSFLMCVFI